MGSGPVSTTGIRPKTNSSEGEEVLRAGDCAGFIAGEANGHHLVNRSGFDALLLEIGSRRPDDDAVDYPDIDLVLHKGDRSYRRRDGSLYEVATARAR